MTFSLVLNPNTGYWKVPPHTPAGIVVVVEPGMRLFSWYDNSSLFTFPSICTLGRQVRVQVCHPDKIPL